MKAALITTFGEPMNVQDVPEPDCPRDGVVVEVRACGVCRSDWHAWKGADPDVSAPHVPGHEFAGVVAEVGPDCKAFRVGQRVTAPFILGCGACPDCRAGDPTICDHQDVIGFTGWGAFAERVAVPHADFNLVALPEGMAFEVAAGMGCRVTTAFRAVVDRAQLQPGEWLAVHGCGGVGLSAIMIAAALGSPVLAIDIDDEKLELARSLGASAVLNAAHCADVGQAVRDMTGGGVQASVDALGVTETFHNSIRGLRKRGRHVQIGMPVGRHAEPVIPLLETVYARQIDIMGTRGIPAHRFEALFGMIAAGRLDPGKLVTKRIALEDAGAELAAMDSFQGVGVTVIDRF